MDVLQVEPQYFTALDFRLQVHLNDVGQKSREAVELFGWRHAVVLEYILNLLFKLGEDILAEVEVGQMVSQTTFVVEFIRISYIMRDLFEAVHEFGDQGVVLNHLTIL